MVVDAAERYHRAPHLPRPPRLPAPRRRPGPERDEGASRPPEGPQADRRRGRSCSSSATSARTRNAWEVLARPSQRLRPGPRAPGRRRESCELVKSLGEGRWVGLRPRRAGPARAARQHAAAALHRGDARGRGPLPDRLRPQAGLRRGPDGRASTSPTRCSTRRSRLEPGSHASPCTSGRGRSCR